MDPEHLSCYILTVDERVPMGRDVARGRISLPSDDDIAEQYELTQTMLAAAGYEQYEISNWARPGRSCRHNLTYWRDEPYVAIGAGAAGWVDGLRTKNTPSPRRYMASVAAGAVEHIEDERPDLMTRLGDLSEVVLGKDERVFLACRERRRMTHVDEVGAERAGRPVLLDDAEGKRAGRARELERAGKLRRRQLGPVRRQALRRARTGESRRQRRCRNDGLHLRSPQRAAKVTAYQRGKSGGVRGIRTLDTGLARITP